MASAQEIQNKMRKRQQMLELTKKGYTPEFIKFGYWAMGEDVSSIDTELSQLSELSGGNPNQVTVDGQKFEINTLADKTAYEKLQAERKQTELVKENAKTDLKTKIEGLTAIETDAAGMESAVGPNPLARPLTPFSGDKQRFIGSVENILSTETLDSLINAKAQGATFGALSEGELRLLQASASKIGKWAKRDDEGNVVGYSVSEEDFVKEVQSLKAQMQNAYDKMNTVEGQQKSGMVKLNGQVIPVSQAVEWAKQNPDDPKAKRVLADHGNLDASAAPESSAEAPGFLSSLAKEIPSLASKFSERLGSAIGDVQAEAAQGSAPSLMGRTGLRAAGVVGGTINDVFGAFLKAGYNSLDDDSKKVLNDTALTVAKTRVGQEGLELLAKGGEEWAAYKEANPERAKDIEDIGNILTAVPLGAFTSKGIKATRKGVASGIDTAVEKTSDVVSKMVGSTGQAPVDDILKAQVEAGLRPEITLNTLSPTARKGAVEAIKQGFDEGQVGMIVSMAPDDRSIATKMLKLADEANSNPRVLQRPIDLAGESLTKKTALVSEKVAEYGKMVDMEAKNLRGISVDASALRQGATQALESLGIKVTSKGMNFENSVFKMTPALQNIIKKFHKAMPKDVTDAYQLHIFKKSVDELVEYGAKGEGLKGNAERFLKSLRTQADDILDASFEGYNAANTNFREAKQIQEAALDLFGKKSGTGSSIRGGQVLRSAFSNNQSRGKVLELAEMLDGYEKKVLGKSSGNVLDQALFAEILEKSGMFKTQAITGFAGQIETAISKTRAVAEGIANPVKGVANAVEYGIEKARNINPQAKRAALEKLLQGILIDEPVQFDSWLMKTIKSLKGKGGLSLQDVSGGKAGYSDPLLQEAKKYKSAEEFVKDQPTIFRGGTDKGRYFSTNETVASDFAKNRGGSVSEHAISPKAKVINYDDIPTAQYKGINDYNMERYGSGKDLLSFQNGKLEADYTKAENWAKQNGYDAVRFPTEGEIRVINDKVVIPKSQLTDLWKKAQGEKYRTAPDSLEESVKKYKSAEHFIYGDEIGLAKRGNQYENLRPLVKQVVDPSSFGSPLGKNGDIISTQSIDEAQVQKYMKIIEEKIAGKKINELPIVILEKRAGGKTAILDGHNRAEAYRRYGYAGPEGVPVIWRDQLTDLYKKGNSDPGEIARYIFDEQGAANTKDVAEKMGISTAEAYKKLIELEKQGYIIGVHKDGLVPRGKTGANLKSLTWEPKSQLTDLWKKAHGETKRGFGTGAGRMKNELEKISLNVGEVYTKGKKIKESILNELADFTEYAAKQKQGSKIERIPEEIRARAIAEKLGINPDVSNWMLSKKFGKLLKENNWDR